MQAQEQSSTLPSRESFSSQIMPSEVIASADQILHEVPWLARIRPNGQSHHPRLYRALKRAMDLSLIVLCLPMLILAFIACMVALKLESPRASVFFTQMRTGQRGQRFRMFKFRTMVPEAEELKRKLAHLNKLQWPDFKVDDDPRVTRVGRLLRRSSLDELPQLINVILGEMSLVGPRPTSFGSETYEEWQKARLEAIPGMTGLWQIAGRGDVEFDERVQIDMSYIERQSLSLDLLILLQTVYAVVRHKGAY